MNDALVAAIVALVSVAPAAVIFLAMVLEIVTRNWK